MAGWSRPARRSNGPDVLPRRHVGGHRQDADQLPQAIPIGEPITVVGEIRRLRGRILETHGEIILQDGSVAAEADATCIKIPEDRVAEMLQETWLYPPEEISQE